MTRAATAFTITLNGRKRERLFTWAGSAPSKAAAGRLALRAGASACRILMDMERSEVGMTLGDGHPSFACHAQSWTAWRPMLARKAQPADVTQDELDAAALALLCADPAITAAKAERWGLEPRGREAPWSCHSADAHLMGHSPSDPSMLERTHMALAAIAFASGVLHYARGESGSEERVDGRPSKIRSATLRAAAIAACESNDEGGLGEALALLEKIGANEVTSAYRAEMGARP